MLQGRNLIIAVDGSTIAAAKSCSVDVQSDTIKVSSPTDGEWEHIIAGRKSWQVQTSHLMPNILQQFPIVEGYSTAWNEGSGCGVKYSYGQSRTSTLPGANLFRVNPNNGNVTVEAYNWNDSNYESDLISALGRSDSTHEVKVLCNADTIVITSGIRQAIASAFNMDVDAIPLPTSISPRCITIVGNATADMSTIEYYEGRGAGTHSKVHLIDNSIIGTEPLLKSYIGKVGTEVTLRMQVDGYGNDYVKGQAIVTAFKSQGSIGNLLTGSFTFKGNGPLS